MFETFDMFWFEFWRTDIIVWWIAALMAIIAGFFLHAYSDNTLMSCLTSFAMFIAILLAHSGFHLMGIVFLGNKSANAAVAAGIAITSLTVLWIVIYRVLVSVGDATNELKGDDPVNIS